MIQEGLYLLRKQEFIQNNQYIYKIGRSNKILNRMHNYSNGSVIYLLISCNNSVLHEKKILEMFRNKYKIQLYYGSEYFLGSVNNMKEDMINYISNVMKNDGYQMVNNEVLIERINRDTNRKIPKYEQSIYNVQIVTIPPIKQILQIKDYTDIVKSVQPINIENTMNNIDDLNTTDSIFSCNCGFKAKFKSKLERHQKANKKCNNLKELEINNQNNINSKELEINNQNNINSKELEINNQNNINSKNNQHKLNNYNESIKLVKQGLLEFEKNILLMKIFFNGFFSCNDNQQKLLLESDEYKKYINIIDMYKHHTNKILNIKNEIS